MKDLILKKIQKEIENFSLDKATVQGRGTVSLIADGILEATGLEGVMMSEIILIKTQDNKSLKKEIEDENNDAIKALVFNIETDLIKAIILGDDTNITEGQEVICSGKMLSVGVSDEIIGRVVDAFGQQIDNKGKIIIDKMMPLEREAYGVMDRSPVNTPLQTGIKVVDTLVPIGRGQRELIIGDHGIGKTVITMNTILNQANEPIETRPICIYVAIGQKSSKISKIKAKLEKEGAMQYTIIVVAGASESASLQYLAPYTGVAIAEFFLEKGKDVVIIYDDLSKHAVAYRQISLLLRRPPGREAYPGDVFYLHSRLLERAVKLNDKLGGGSITALPIIETQEGDVSAYIPTNVISITDGQIFLNTVLFNQGIRPAVDVGLSVSRVGSAAQTKAIKKISGPVKLMLAQFKEMEAFMQFSSDLDKKTRDKIEFSKKIVEFLKQKVNSPLPFEKQAVVLFFATNKNFVKDIPLNRVEEAEYCLLLDLEAQKPEILEKIKKTGKFEDDTREELNKFILEFLSYFIKKENG
ncbi:MAG: F0F1 ATP synthase subunit alpha [Candidatus Pacebacteria bacterium]|nr:F0F1 ATP synthase subunit alpha [Candidatus Paceibacterota bacterium]